jgi:D-glycero-alpha-D-manno-heptose-7-phosphate kinase
MVKVCYLYLMLGLEFGDFTMRAFRARAPLRISFGGGGTDVSPYTEEYGGAVLSTTIDRYAFATVRPVETGRIRIASIDYDRTVEYGLTDTAVVDSQLALAQGIVDYFRRNHGLDQQCPGLDIRLHNDAPPGSGLGSSSSIAVALIGALGALLNMALDSYALADLAYVIERVDVGIKGGRQDQYSAAFGGLNFMEFRTDFAVIHPIRLWADTWNELQYSMVFAYIGGQRFSGDLIDRQIERVVTNDSDSLKALDDQKRIAYKMKDALLMRRIDEFGRLLHEAWSIKKRVSSGITNDRIDEIYDAVRQAGAVSGKVSGAGGGGFMMFFCDPSDRFRIQEAVRAIGCEPVHLQFVQQGLAVWPIER